MAYKILMPNPINYMNHIVPQSMDVWSQSLGQLSLPKYTKISSSKRRGSSVIASASAVALLAAAKPTTTSVVGTKSITTSPSTPTPSYIDLANSWREIQGANNWESLIDPLNPLLRQEIIRYGEFVAACYKAFDLDSNSKRYLNCKYGKKNILKEVGMDNSGYEVTKYIYATPDLNNIPIQNCGRWVGYVAVSSDESVRKLGRRDILVTFRGTVTNPEWIANFMSSLTPAKLDPHEARPDVKVESGFLSLYTSDESSGNKFGVGSCREQLLSEVSRLLHKYKGEELSLTLAGHSMGSSLALLLAYDITELGLNKTDSNLDVPVTVFSYGGPRVGNSGFKERCEELGVKVLRIANTNDPITKLPGVVFNENFRVFGGRYEFPWSCSCYAHVGVELVLDFFNMQNLSCVHDLETYISLLKSSCPNNSSSTVHEIQGDRRNIRMDFLSKARELLSSSAQTFNMFPNWKNVALNLVQSQRT